MKLLAKYPKVFFELTLYFSTFIRFLLNILLVIVCAALVVGTYKAGLDLVQSFNKPLEYILQHMLLDVIFIVALVEITITILGYLKDGSVHVRYIVDTILIIMLNEIVNVWLNHPKFEQVAGLSLIVGVLALVRMMVIQFAPKEKAVDGKDALAASGENSAKKPKI